MEYEPPLNFKRPYHKIKRSSKIWELKHTGEGEYTVINYDKKQERYQRKMKN